MRLDRIFLTKDTTLEVRLHSVKVLTAPVEIRTGLVAAVHTTRPMP